MDVLPLGVGIGQRAGAPQADPAAGHEPDRVHSGEAERPRLRRPARPRAKRASTRSPSGETQTPRCVSIRARMPATAPPAGRSRSPTAGARGGAGSTRRAPTAPDRAGPAGHVRGGALGRRVGQVESAALLSEQRSGDCEGCGPGLKRTRGRRDDEDVERRQGERLEGAQRVRLVEGRDVRMAASVLEEEPARPRSRPRWFRTRSRSP